jgi:hypothetical protein
MSLQLTVIPQITESHCGPAVLQMLLSYHGQTTGQRQIEAAGRVKSTILRHGMRPARMAEAVAKVSQKLRYWFKNEASITDLERLVNLEKVPVGVNWQGMFYRTEALEQKHDPKGDHGHYSLVIGLNRTRNMVTLADPFPDFAPKKRHFKLSWFKTRWWDAARDVHPKTKEVSLLRSKRFMFVLAPPNAPYLKALSFRPASQLSSLYLPEKEVNTFSDTFPYKSL